MFTQELELKIRTLFAENQFNQHLGMQLLEVREGYAKGCIPMQSFHENVYGGMHGGCIYALADAISGISAASYGSYVTTLNGSMNYLLAAKKTEHVFCEATTVRMGRTIGVIDAKLYGDDGTVFATACFNYYRLADALK